MYLVWQNLSVELSNAGNGSSSNNNEKLLLRELTGFAEPGRIMAVMGPSGSGKSTLLDALAGRLAENVKMTGQVLINGRKRDIGCRDISYVTQEDLFLGTLTVRETIAYSAHMRFPGTMSKEEIDNVVENTIQEMGLEECANTKIGNWHLRGISNGEKKRLSIAIEILTHPHILFLDEPTTGLDSASAFFVILSLRNIACDGKIVLCSIHQPSSDIFNMFDDLLLLSNGETVYFGEAKMAIKFFAEAGFPCPTRRNPSDHFLRCISSDFDIINEVLLRSQNLCGNSESTSYSLNMRATEIRAILIDKYNCSELSNYTRRRIQEIAMMGGSVIESKKGSSASQWKQLWRLTDRSFVNMYRDMGYYWLRIVLYVLVAICIGTLYFDMGKDDGAILPRVKLTGFIYGFMICLSNGGLPFFIEEMKVSRRERSNGHYGEAVFVLSNFISSFPYLILISILSGTAIYFMVKFRSGFSHYAFFCMNLFCCVSVIESCMMVVASLVPNVLMGIGTGTGAIVFMMMASEVSRPLEDLPKIFWRYPMSYISFVTWAVQGQYKNDMAGLEFDSLIPGKSKMKGEIILQTLFGVPMGYSKWLDLTALTFILFAHRILFYMILKYKSRVMSLLKRVHTRRTLKSLANRVYGARHNGLSSSKRHHHSLHPLSSQEGLRSPIP